MGSFESMEGRIRSRPLQGVMENWRAAMLPASALPNFLSYHLVVREHAQSSFLASVEPDGFRFVTVGDRLTERLGRHLAGETVGNDADALFGSLKATYSRCVEHRAPCYEFLRYDFGEGGQGLFERLTLPLADGPARVSHVCGTVSFDDPETKS